MTILEFVHAALPISLMMVVLAIGMRCTWGEAMSLFHEPALLARTLHRLPEARGRLLSQLAE